MRFSTKRGLIQRRAGFTIREILIVILVISVGLLSVVVVLTNGMKYVQKTRQKVIALNLAREGMEAVYQIRDTNRTRRTGSKDACRLKINPLDEGSQGCSGDSWMGSGAYVLQRLATGEQQYFALVGPLTGIDLGDGIDTGDYSFSLCQQGGYWNPCSGQSLDTREGTYFRQITGRGLYLKDVPTSGGQQIPCRSGTSSLCGSDTPKEFRFCSKVVYMGEGTSEVQFCGVITNFK